ncbi:MAG: type I DNA topoisomerase [Clostridia bacterium]|nr:type I DNA topoisomerase [Clostridia bacterium]
MSSLVIVESPPKAVSIKSYLGSGYKVIASKGHIRDLPKSILGVDIENGFAPHYINIRGKGDLIKELRREAKNADYVYFATDPDREGEAITWHLATVLGIPVEKIRRITFNEVTKKAVREAIKSPGKLNMNLVNAQQTRRILDRIVGYKISPHLWKGIKSGLSAGRVQSVATRIIVDRENEIRAFKPSEYWTIDAHLLAEDSGRTSFVAHFYGTRAKKVQIKNETEANTVANAVDGKKFRAVSVKKTVRHKSPAPPFTTSTMQQEASKRLGFQSARIMKVAQELYEGINVGSENGGTQGLITYMRTDSLRISADAQNAALELIKAKYGKAYCPSTPRVYKSKSNSQDAHEAIRPSHVELEPAKIQKYLTADQYKLYKLIWDRFVASQMQSAKLNVVGMDFECEGYIFRSSGYTVNFDGYMAVYNDGETADDTGNEKEKNIRLPEVAENSLLDLDRLDKTQHFTEPPPRYSEASLIKFLEEKGIGRPSTITPTITTILARNYVKREGKVFVPTPLGEITTKLMMDNFPNIVNYQFTAEMEDYLDAIEQGSSTMLDVLSNFWADFSVELEKAAEVMQSGKYSLPAEETDFICEKCGSRMVVRESKYGRFAACPRYPECKFTRPLDVPVTPSPAKVATSVASSSADVANMKCEKCGSEMVERSGRYGVFYACSKYPECNFTRQKTVDTGVSCPDCGGKILLKNKGKTIFYSCENYPDCKFSSWDAPTKMTCPGCGKMLFKKKGKTNTVYCHNPSCKYTMVIEELTEG